MKITDLIQMDSIFLDSNASSQSSMFKEISDRISEKVKVSSSLILRRINEREKLGSTAIGEGIAIPHAKIPGLTRSHCGLAVNKKGIDFDSVDGELTKIIIVLLHPEADSKNHLLILKNIATLFSDKKIVNEIIQSNESYDIYRLIQSYEKK